MSKVLISIAGKLRVPTALLALVCCAAAANGPFIKQDDTIEPAVVEEDVYIISTKPTIKLPSPPSVAKPTKTAQ